MKVTSPPKLAVEARWLIVSKVFTFSKPKPLNFRLFSDMKLLISTSCSIRSRAVIVMSP